MQDKKKSSVKSSKKKAINKKKIAKRVPPLPAKEMVWWVKYLVILALIVVLIWPLGLGLLWSGNSLYKLIDPTEFPKLDNTIVNLMKTTSSSSPPAKKGVALCEAIINRLNKELHSRLGWSVNDIIISPTAWLDNRSNRQRGVIFATRMLVNFFATNFAKYGGAGAEDEDLKKAREEYFAYTPDSWWFPSSENQYKKGIEMVRRYEKRLLEGDAVYNVRSDKLYSLFSFILSPEFLDQPLGLLVEPNEKVKYLELDNRIYYTQGVILVLRDFLHVLTYLYPEIESRGGKDNLQLAFDAMDKICTYDPLVVLRGAHDSIFADHRGKMARYLITVRERLRDVTNSLNR
ncbi:hypothetical protein JCM12298_12700 [Desulfothermus naphthae]